MGLDISLYRLSTGRGIEFDSKTDPKHLFKIGYFRSSYNSAGFNSRMELWGLPTLYELFPEGGDGGYSYVVVDWMAALDRAVRALGLAEDKFANEAIYDVKDVFAHDNFMREVTSTDAALKTFKDEMSKDCAFGSWTSGNGLFSKKPIEVVGVIPGFSCGMRTVFVITTVDRDTLNWYANALKIVIETIEYVLAHDDPNDYVLAWSG